MKYISQNRRINRQIAQRVRKDMNEAFLPAVDAVRGMLLRSAGADGKIDPRRHEAVKVSVGDIVQRLFVGADMRHAFAADGITPLAPIPKVLNKWYAAVVLYAVKRQHDWMKRIMPDDLYEWYSAARVPDEALVGEVSPYGEGDGIARVFVPNPLATIDPTRAWVPLHRWNTPDGYRLSDRLWRASIRTRMQIDAMLSEGMREGTGSLVLSRRLERFLLPGRAALRTRKPYGVDASFNSMRLARTEIARSHNAAAYQAAYLNPYVDRIDVARSPQGDPTCKVCPQHATLGMGGERLREPYAVGGANYPIYHPHCMCVVLPVVAESPAQVTARLREEMEVARAEYLEPVLTPVAQQALIEYLLGAAFMQMMGQVIQLPLI